MLNRIVILTATLFLSTNVTTASMAQTSESAQEAQTEASDNLEGNGSAIFPDIYKLIQELIDEVDED